jgi:hypothetical protein
VPVFLVPICVATITISSRYNCSALIRNHHLHRVPDCYGLSRDHHLHCVPDCSGLSRSHHLQCIPLEEKLPPSPQEALRDRASSPLFTPI